jgi:hypothetical protein
MGMGKEEEEIVNKTNPRIQHILHNFLHITMDSAESGMCKHAEHACDCVKV